MNYPTGPFMRYRMRGEPDRVWLDDSSDLEDIIESVKGMQDDLRDLNDKPMAIEHEATEEYDGSVK